MAYTVKTGRGAVLATLTAAGLTLLAAAASAHHSSAGFESEKTIALNGTVREFQWANPHIWIQLNVTAADGASEEWSVEGGVPNRLFRAGWRPDSFTPGEEVTIVVRPMKDGGKAGIFVGAKFPDGSTLGRFPDAP